MDPVGVFGLGYIGREVSKLAAERGHDVYGIDIDRSVVDELIEEGFGCDLPGDVSLGTEGQAVVDQCDVLIVAVPTSLRTNYTVDLSALIAACETIAEGIDPDSDRPSVVVESTIGPGTLRNIVAPIFEAEDLRRGADFRLAHVPERIDPGNEEWGLEDIPRVVGALTDDGCDVVASFYDMLLDAHVHPVSQPEVAEASKIIENAYRDINIAFVNEIAVSLDQLGVDAVEALDAAETKPFGFQRFSPGAGVGGHCIPIDPYMLIEQGRKNEFDHELLKIARDINDYMPRYVAEKTIKALNSADVLPKGSTVTLLGRSFKPDVSDTRNTPHDSIKAYLQEYGVVTKTHDPFVIGEEILHSPYQQADAVVLITAHTEYLDLDFERLADAGVRVFVDGRNVVDPRTVRTANIEYVGVGRE